MRTVVELREIEVFLVLVEELHFGRTAERLRLSPSRISQTVRVLERRVDGRLFERTSRKVVLTPLGQRLSDGLRTPFEEIHRVMRSLGEVGEVGGEVRISVANRVCAGPLFIEILKTFETTHPDCRTVVREETTLDGLDRLRRREADVMIAWQPMGQADMTVGPVVSRQSRVLLVRRDHHLVRRGYAIVEDLAECDLPDGGGVPTATLDAFMPPTTPSGRPIRRRYAQTTLTEAVWRIAMGLMAHPTVETSPQFYDHPDIVALPLQGLPPLESALIWATGRETPLIHAFAQAVTEVRRRSAAAIDGAT
ncbi:LysR family transcriptional regulator [Nonomuraea antimicrobica]|uniref:LysR family transcriptional regulator n=1 Tax=Nonomuraea antimicrobica TaxID=561173 RepID=A0ABP7D0A7_9ACTN